jgi:hypothetical protein
LGSKYLGFYCLSSAKFYRTFVAAVGEDGLLRVWKTCQPATDPFLRDEISGDCTSLAILDTTVALGLEGKILVARITDRGIAKALTKVSSNAEPVHRLRLFQSSASPMVAVACAGNEMTVWDVGSLWGERMLIVRPFPEKRLEDARIVKFEKQELLLAAGTHKNDLNVSQIVWKPEMPEQINFQTAITWKDSNAQEVLDIDEYGKILVMCDESYLTIFDSLSRDEQGDYLECGNNGNDLGGIARIFNLDEKGIVIFARAQLPEIAIIDPRYDDSFLKWYGEGNLSGDSLWFPCMATSEEGFAFTWSNRKQNHHKIIMYHYDSSVLGGLSDDGDEHDNDEDEYDDDEGECDDSGDEDGNADDWSDSGDEYDKKYPDGKYDEYNKEDFYRPRVSQKLPLIKLLNMNVESILEVGSKNR